MPSGQEQNQGSHKEAARKGKKRSEAFGGTKGTSRRRLAVQRHLGYLEMSVGSLCERRFPALQQSGTFIFLFVANPQAQQPRSSHGSDVSGTAAIAAPEAF